ncbi:BolA family protein [Legionella septentrionalis]|uniref:BolA/IbaG family iron-sulfur metabolism protein n=1 Tax=Legionella septentrionalis TaxID=2498109 RepID=A0A433JJG3_9GAMM|nr:BolA/IbaG family iron-sulfur metabolism protein [Legionella septentrionalis]RUQ88233.1 BolA/IbaG family iron-sulfur metabolism protein [Legionella septentrionalis]RUQ97475.1 BolA/IbaG family iron-sulfur metabolism protein [Legionella septentrionalis]RUR15937.1 BolA/IbaG family iron-sulfur metabolism protein [Legionella septentrionalis]
MISNEQLEQQLRGIPDVDYVQVSGDGYHYHLTIVSDAFLNKSKVARQQWVYTQLKEHIASGRLHALSMKTWTKEEWEKQHG